MYMVNFTKKFFLKNLKIIDYISLFLILYLIFQNILGLLNQLDYRHLHIDERQLIDSILNVYQLNDEFGRFDSINSETLRNTLVVISELVIGGNLDYGRLYTNIFIIAAGPLYYLGFESLLIASRIIQMIIMIYTLIYISKYFINSQFRFIFVLFSLSMPGAYYLIQNPKPDPLVLLLIFVGIKKISVDNKTKSSFIYLGMSVGVKIIAIIPVFIFILFLFIFEKKFTSLKETLNLFIYFCFGLAISQPALLIPSPQIYSRIISALKVGSVYDQDKFLKMDFNNFSIWFKTLSDELDLSVSIFYIILLLGCLSLIKSVWSRGDYLDIYMLLTFLVFLLFITLNIQRIWNYYLTIPFIFLLIYLFFKKKNITKLKMILLIFAFILSISGFIAHNDKAVNSYFQVDINMEQSFSEAVLFLEENYSNRPMKYNLVYWDPDLYFPRYEIDYNEKFKVLENWEYDQNYLPLYSKVDFIVSLRQIELTIGITEKKFGDTFVYYLDKSS